MLRLSDYRAGSQQEIRTNRATGNQVAVTNPINYRAATVITGTPTPNNGDKKNPTPFTMSCLLTQNAQGSIRRTTGTTNYTYTGDFYGGSELADSDTLTDVTDRALRAFTRNLYSELGSDAQMDVTIAELLSAQANVVDKKLRQDRYLTVNALDRHRRKAIRRTGKAWLFMQFAAFPVLNDFFAVARTALEGAAGSGLRVNVKGQASSSPGATQRYRFEMGNISVDAGPIPMSGRTSARYRGGYRLNVNALAAITRFASLDPMRFAYEMVPFSWLVDYVYDIGGALADFEAAAKYKSAFRSGYQTYSYLVQHHAVCNYTRTIATDSRAGQLESDRIVKYFNRKIVTGFPRPQPPRLQCELGSGKLLNLAAFLGAKVGYGRKPKP